MPRRVPLSLTSMSALLAVVSACHSSAPPRCPDATVATEPSVSTPPPRAPDVDPGPAPPPPPYVDGIRAPADFPVSSVCGAPLPITQEINRLLIAAAAHATRSMACMDGPGQRRVVNDVLVCPAAPRDGDRIMKVFYRVVTYPEGDTRACPAGQTCEGLAPSATEHLVELRVRPRDPERGVLVELPELPGFTGGTPLHQEHDGGCYGKSPAFTPATVPFGR